MSWRLLLVDLVRVQPGERSPRQTVTGNRSSVSRVEGDGIEIATNVHRRAKGEDMTPFPGTKAPRVNISLLALLFVAPLVGCGTDDAEPAANKDVVATAQAAGTFNTLIAALTAGDLVTTLKGTGPFTVLAPTDAAFAKLPTGTVDTLLQPENKAMLQSVLTYHVVAGKVMAADIVKLTSANTLQGAAVTITVTGTMVKVNDATVVQTDIEASNGVIHVIDAVLLPPT